MSALLRSEIERDLSRRVVRVLVFLALVATGVAAVIVFVNAEEPVEAGAEPAYQRCIDERRAFWEGDQLEGGAGDLTERQFVEDACRDIYSSHQRGFHLRDLWNLDGGDEAYLGITTIFLAIGALFAGASVVGAEWKAGTIATLLTWEPRRARVALAKLAAAALLAFLIAVALQLVFSASLWPTAAVKGSTAGLDGEWWRGYAGAVLRSGLITAMAAVLGASVAFVGRSASAALGFAVGYLIVVENVVRAWKPWLAPWLIGDSAGVVLTGERFEAVQHTRDLPAALATLLVYLAIAATAAVVTFHARDVASTA